MYILQVQFFSLHLPFAQSTDGCHKKIILPQLDFSYF